jgi:hypothetical protein
MCSQEMEEYVNYARMYLPRGKDGNIDWFSEIQPWEFNYEAREEMKRQAFMEILGK